MGVEKGLVLKSGASHILKHFRPIPVESLFSMDHHHGDSLLLDKKRSHLFDEYFIFIKLFYS